VSIRNCCNRPIIKNCYLEKGIAFILRNIFNVKKYDSKLFVISVEINYLKIFNS
jgi:hypothetical protein